MNLENTVLKLSPRQEDIHPTKKLVVKVWMFVKYKSCMIMKKIQNFW